MESTIVMFKNIEEIKAFAREVCEEMRRTELNDNKLLSAKEAADMLGVSVSTLYRYEKNGNISSVSMKDAAKRYRLCDVNYMVRNNVN